MSLTRRFEDWLRRRQLAPAPVIRIRVVDGAEARRARQVIFEDQNATIARLERENAALRRRLGENLI